VSVPDVRRKADVACVVAAVAMVAAAGLVDGLAAAGVFAYARSH